MFIVPQSNNPSKLRQERNPMSLLTELRKMGRQRGYKDFAPNGAAELRTLNDSQRFFYLLDEPLERSKSNSRF